MKVKINKKDFTFTGFCHSAAVDASALTDFACIVQNCGLVNKTSTM